MHKYVSVCTGCVHACVFVPVHVRVSVYVCVCVCVCVFNEKLSI